jgi:hypothetical protein
VTSSESFNPPPRAFILSLVEGQNAALESIELDGVPGTVEDVPIVGMFSRARSLFRSVFILLKAEQALEALLPARSLFELSMRFLELKHAGPVRGQHTLHHELVTLQYQENVLREAPRLDPARRQAEMFTIETRRKQVQQTAARLGLPLVAFSKDLRGAAERFSRKSQYWQYVLAHHSVHGTHVSHALRARKRGTNELHYFSRGDSAWMVLNCAILASQSVTDCASVFCNVFGLPNPDGLIFLDGLFDALQQTPPTSQPAE